MMEKLVAGMGEANSGVQVSEKSIRTTTWDDSIRIFDGKASEDFNLSVMCAETWKRMPITTYAVTLCGERDSVKQGEYYGYLVRYLRWCVACHRCMAEVICSDESLLKWLLAHWWKTIRHANHLLDDTL